jgi:hypothetical protein
LTRERYISYRAERRALSHSEKQPSPNTVVAKKKSRRVGSTENQQVERVIITLEMLAQPDPVA